MLRYQAAALAWKAFSTTPATRRLYRKLGNAVKGRSTTDLRRGYIERGAWLIQHLRAFGLLDGRELHVLETGTGWMNFLGMTLALAGVSHVDLYDVWDNRQFGRMQRSFATIAPHFAALGLTPEEQRKAAVALEKLVAAKGFDELYEALGLSYIVDPTGELDPIATGTYDALCSIDVFEHVYSGSLRKNIGGMFRVLKPGGYSLHQVGLDDHLAHSDKSASPKQYLQFGDTEWKLRFDNDVQHFNRVTHDELRRYFRDAGFEEVSVTAELNREAVDRLPRIAKRFRNQSEESLYATRGFMIHRKPI